MEHAKSGDSDPLTPPAELKALLTANDSNHADAAWMALVAKHSRILLHTIRSRCQSYDQAMDRYTYVLERLRECDFARLRKYAADGRGEFSTWLVVVCRRLCEDYRRKIYGRPDPDPAGSASQVSARRELRRRLADMVGADRDISSLPERRGGNPESRARWNELQAALEEGLARLDPADRLLLKYRFESELTAREIARLMKFPSQFHVYTRVNSRLRVLRRFLREKGFTEARP